MFFPAVYNLVSLALLLTPVLSAPIHHHYDPNAQPSLDKRSMFFGHSHPHEAEAAAAMVKRDLADLVARDESSILEARSFDDMEESLAKREIQNLVRRKKSSSAPKVSHRKRWFSAVC